MNKMTPEQVVAILPQLTDEELLNLQHNLGLARRHILGSVRETITPRRAYLASAAGIILIAIANEISNRSQHSAI